MDAIVTDATTPDMDELLGTVRAETARMLVRGTDLDAAGCFPEADLRFLRDAGALAAPLPVAQGGLGLGTSPAGALPLFHLLRAVGHGSLPLGRVFEGHVNGIRLIARYGDAAQLRHAADAALAGHLFALWNTQPADDPVRITRDGGAVAIEGSKTLASAAGFATRPVVTAAQPGDGAQVLVVLDLSQGERADLSGWTAHGMRASATGRVHLGGLPITQRNIVGRPGDYLRQPDFAAGAWRTSAVTLGGLDALIAAYRGHLRATGRGDDPHQRARLGTAVMAQETASLWLQQAARRAESRAGDPEETVAYVNLARLATEASCLQGMQLAQRSIGLAAFMRPSPIERLCRDLATYLRQPAPDYILTEAAGYFLGHDLPSSF